jgi:hypothetical protein
MPSQMVAEPSTRGTKAASAVGTHASGAAMSCIPFRSSTLPNGCARGGERENVGAGLRTGVPLTSAGS